MMLYHFTLIGFSLGLFLVSLAGFFSINDNIVTISNNVEHIEYLEDGTSRQAASGMVAVSLVEFEISFREHLKGLKGVSPA